MRSFVPQKAYLQQADGADIEDVDSYVQRSDTRTW